MKVRTKRILFWTGLVMVAYFVLYFSSVQAATYKSAGAVTPRPIYGWPDGDLADVIFAPAHFIDATFLRRGYWAPIPPRGSANQPAQRMAAGGRISRVRGPGAAAIADFPRYAA